MALLVQFLLRLSFGMAAGMALVSPRDASSGFYRNHLYVVLGLSAMSALLSRAACPPALWWCLAAAALAYMGAVCWLYEKPRAGRILLVVLAAVSLMAAWRAAPTTASAAAGGGWPPYLRGLQTLTSGAVLGMTTTAMLLGHWYLNAPGMKLAPLRKMLAAIAIAVIIQGVVCGAGLALAAAEHPVSLQQGLFLLMRWLFGIVGVLALVWMAWRTLEVPNTQSATGILYVAVIGAFVGETASLLLSAEQAFPV
jgi:hypothetical protein